MDGCRMVDRMDTGNRPAALLSDCAIVDLVGCSAGCAGQLDLAESCASRGDVEMNPTRTGRLARGVLSAFLGFVMCAGTVSADLEQALEVERAALDSLKAKLIRDQEALQQTESRQQFVAKDLERKERDISQIKGELREIERRGRELSGRLGGTRQELKKVESRLQAREAGMAHRLREMYKRGRRGDLQILFGSESFPQALKRLRYLSRIAEQDRTDYNAIKSDRRRIKNVARLQETQYDHQRTLLKAKQTSEDRLKRRAEQRVKELQELKEDRKAWLKGIRRTEEEMAESERRVGEYIKEIQKRQFLVELPPFDFIGHKGKLARPVDGKILVQFGRTQDPELKTWTINRGINIGAAEGTEVLSIAPAEAVLVDWFPGYGQFVLLRHPGGYYSLYGHLLSVQVNQGQLIAKGAVLGLTGSTGRVDGVSQLHFEIMKGENPLDPQHWLSW